GAPRTAGGRRIGRGSLHAGSDVRTSRPPAVDEHGGRRDQADRPAERPAGARLADQTQAHQGGVLQHGAPRPGQAPRLLRIIVAPPTGKTLMSYMTQMS